MGRHARSATSLASLGKRAMMDPGGWLLRVLVRTIRKVGLSGRWAPISKERKILDSTQAHVAARYGPLVVLLEQDCANEADDRDLVGKMLATLVRRLISRLSRSSGFVERIWLQWLLWNDM